MELLCIPCLLCGYTEKWFEKTQKNFPVEISIKNDGGKTSKIALENFNFLFVCLYKKIFF